MVLALSIYCNYLMILHVSAFIKSFKIHEDGSFFFRSKAIDLATLKAEWVNVAGYRFFPIKLSTVEQLELYSNTDINIQRKKVTTVTKRESDNSLKERR